MSAMQPIHDRVVVEPHPSNDRTKTGLFIPDSAKEKSQKGKVIAIGEGRITDHGILIGLKVNIGDEVMYGLYSGSEFEFDEKKYIMMRESDIYMIVKD